MKLATVYYLHLLFSYTSKQFNADACSLSVDLGYVHLPCQTKNTEQDQLVDINDKTLDDLTMKNYIMSIENVV